jgi:hypothetical protein
MFARSLIALLCVVSASATLGAEPEKSAEAERPKSAAGVAALNEYDKASQAADLVWKQQKAVAERKLIEKMKVAMNVATRAGDLNEANRIDQQIKAATGRLEAATLPQLPEGTGLVVRRAMWYGPGKEEKAIDVTDQVRDATRANVIEKVDIKAADPAYGVHKILSIDATYRGVAFNVQVRDEGHRSFRLEMAPGKGK